MEEVSKCLMDCLDKTPYLMLLITGVSASRNASIAIGLQASTRDAPNAR